MASPTILLVDTKSICKKKKKNLWTLCISTFFGKEVSYWEFTWRRMFKKYTVSFNVLRKTSTFLVSQSIAIHLSSCVQWMGNLQKTVTWKCQYYLSY